MSVTESKPPRRDPQRTRRDGWTAERQLRFLAALQATRSVTRAAIAAGMSRKSAYRLRARPEAALFAAAWSASLRLAEGHQVGAAASVSGGRPGPVFRANRAKDTKCAKFVTPRFDAPGAARRDLFLRTLARLRTR